MPRHTGQRGLFAPATAALLMLGLAVAAGCDEDEDEDDEGSGEAGEVSALVRVESGEAVYGTSFVSPGIELEGEMLVGSDRAFVTANTRFAAADGHRIELGNRTNVQDNVSVTAATGSAAIHAETSLAHGAIVEDSEIGDQVFLGFTARVTDATVEDGATILHGARLEGVTIPENALVGVGEVVTTQRQADALPKTDRDTADFKRAVLDVNAEFAEGYIEIYETEGEDALTGIGPNPVTSLHPKAVTPEVEEGELGELVRIVGDVRLATGARVGDRTAIRADEGTPITIGANATIGAHATFHALEHTELSIGDEFTAGDHSVIHGPLEIGDRVRVGPGAVVFQAVVGDDVEIGEGAVVAGPDGDEPKLEIPDGAVIGDGAVVTGSGDLEGPLE